MGREDEIRLIAYKIWEEGSCLDGKDCEHWLRAETIWEHQQNQNALEKNIKVPAKQPSKQSTKVLAEKEKSAETITGNLSTVNPE